MTAPNQSYIRQSPLELAQLLNAASENLRSADKTPERVEAAFRIANKLDEIAKELYTQTGPTHG